MAEKTEEEAFYVPKPAKMVEDVPDMSPKMASAPRSSPFLVEDYRGKDAYKPIGP